MESASSKFLIRSFSEYPGPRYDIQGEHSGEEFYHSVLNQLFVGALQSKQKIEIVLDGTAGYASSFLDQAFGSLVYDFGQESVERFVSIISSEEPDWISLIRQKVYVEWQNRRNKNLPPKVTKVHGEWFRLVDGKLEKRVWIQP